VTIDRSGREKPAPEDPAPLVVKLQPESQAARYGVGPVCGGLALCANATVFVPASMRLGWATAWRIRSGISCWARTPTPLLESCAELCYQKTGKKLRRVTLGFAHSQNQQIRTWIAKRSRQWNLVAASNLPRGCFQQSHNVRSVAITPSHDRLGAVPLNTLASANSYSGRIVANLNNLVRS